MPADLYILGGYQTDFARNYNREGLSIFDMMKECVEGAFDCTGIEPHDIDVCHIGNFAAEMFVAQGQLGGFLGHIHPDLVGVPASRHEAACASGSIAMLAAGADLEAGRYGLALVVGLELMRNVPGQTAAEHLGSAGWTGLEANGATFAWPYMFSQVADEYDRRYGLDRRHLAAISQMAFSNAKRNAFAQTRNWTVTSDTTGEDDEINPFIEGRLRRSDCGQVTDGAAAVFLANRATAERYCHKHDMPLDSLARVKGWGHTTDSMLLDTKIRAAREQSHLFPVARKAMLDALRRAAMDSVFQCDGMEVHDCFSITEYMIIDHFGITAPGESWKAIEDGTIAAGGRLPINPSGGLIGLGHPVGASGVRMVLDASRQVTGKAGDCQVPRAKNFATYNLGGSATTSVCFIIGR